MHCIEVVLEDHPDAIAGPKCSNAHSSEYPVACPDYSWYMSSQGSFSGTVQGAGYHV